jgi:hypothetical protein
MARPKTASESVTGRAALGAGGIEGFALPEACGTVNDGLKLGPRFRWRSASQ